MTFIKRIDSNLNIGGATLNDFSFKKLDRTIEVYEDRLKVIKNMLEGNTYFEELFEKWFTHEGKWELATLHEDFEFAKRLESFANYLLFSPDVERGAKLDNNIYENNTLLNMKQIRSKVYVYDILKDTDRIKELNKKNFKKEKDLTFNNISRKKITEKYPFVEEYYKLLDYINENPNCKVKKTSIQDDILYIADRNTIYFKSPLSDKGNEINLDSVEFTNVEVNKILLKVPAKYEYDLTNNLDIIQYDFNELVKRTNLTNKQKVLVNKLKQGYTQNEICELLNVTKSNISNMLLLIAEKVKKQYIKERRLSRNC